MQDNNTNLTSKLFQRDIKSREEQYVLQLMSCPAKSVDLNPIEQVWDELVQKGVILINNNFKKDFDAFLA